EEAKRARGNGRGLSWREVAGASDSIQSCTGGTIRQLYSHGKGQSKKRGKGLDCKSIRRGYVGYIARHTSETEIQEIYVRSRESGSGAWREGNKMHCKSLAGSQNGSVRGSQK